MAMNETHAGRSILHPEGGFDPMKMSLVPMALAAHRGFGLPAMWARSLKQERDDALRAERLRRNGLDTAAVWARGRRGDILDAITRAALGLLTPARGAVACPPFTLTRIDSLQHGRYGPFVCGGVLALDWRRGLYKAADLFWNGSTLGVLDSAAAEAVRRLEAELADTDAALATPWDGMSAAALEAACEDGGRHPAARRLAAAALARKAVRP